MRCLVAVLCIAAVLADGKCKVSKVHSVCESRCESDGRPSDRTAVPPPGTLLPPTGIYTGVDETTPPPAPPANKPTPADSSDKGTSLLELESSSSDFPAVLMKRGPLTSDEIESHIAPIPLLAWTNMHKASFGCTDGRAYDSGIFTWGGDIAEFATALNVYEQMATIQLSQQQVTSIFRKYLETSSRKKFRTCMTTDAAKQLFGNVENLAAAAKNPPEERQAALWIKVAEPNYVGNDHVRLMLESPDEYLVRKELVQHLVRSFFDILWNPFDPLRDHVDVQILRGDRLERGILAVTVPDFCLKQAAVAPLLTPRQDARSIAIINPDAVQILRSELSTFFSRETLPVVRSDEFNKRVNILASGQGTLTKQKLYPNTPNWNARISE